MCALIRVAQVIARHAEPSSVRAPGFVDLTEMPALWGYSRDLFQTPGFGCLFQR